MPGETVHEVSYTHRADCAVLLSSRMPAGLGLARGRSRIQNSQSGTRSPVLRKDNQVLTWVSTERRRDRIAESQLQDCSLNFSLRPVRQPGAGPHFPVTCADWQWWFLEEPIRSQGSRAQSRGGWRCGSKA